jgi:hypothetical protein
LKCPGYAVADKIIVQKQFRGGTVTKLVVNNVRRAFSTYWSAIGGLNPGYAPMDLFNAALSSVEHEGDECHFYR